MDDDFDEIAKKRFEQTACFVPSASSMYISRADVANALTGLYRVALPEQRETIEIVAATLGCKLQ